MVSFIEANIVMSILHKLGGYGYNREWSVHRKSAIYRKNGLEETVIT